MGILCPQCENAQLGKEENENKKEGSVEKIRILNEKAMLDLPKQFVNCAPKKIEVKISESLLNFENDEPDNENVSDNDNNQLESNQSKPNKIKNQEDAKEDGNLINNKNGTNENGKFTQRKGRQFQTVRNPKDLTQNKNKNEEELSNFKRRRKKCATIMENSKIIHQLFEAEMRIPVSQEILVQQKKGKPSQKFIIGKKIGKGTFGSVYESKNIIFNSKVAMKIIPKNVDLDVLLIKNEIDILKKLSHPNIVRIYEFYESNNCFYLINEHCPEGELYKYINNSKLNEQQLAVIFYQVFSGLQYLHDNKIIHRDLKPENILISKKEKDLKDGEEYFWIQIIDFGTAKIFEKNKKESSIVGSPYYIAPEVLKKDYNEKCDTWSIGVILYMFLTSMPPFNGSNNEEIVNSIMTKDYDENNQKLLTHSKEVRDLIKHLLDKDKDKRLSAKEALNHEWFKKYNGRKIFGNFKAEDIQPYIDNLLNYTFNSKIQQLVIAFLVHNLPQTESSHNILKMFRYFNKSGECKLTKEELINGLKEFGFGDGIKEKVDNLMFLLDGDNNGYIEYEEFLRACVNKKEILTDKYLKYAFKFLDKQNNYLLSAQQICEAFLIEGNQLFETAISKVINEIDADDDGMIDFEEFKQFMLKTMN